MKTRAWVSCHEEEDDYDGKLYKVYHLHAKKPNWNSRRWRSQGEVNLCVSMAESFFGSDLPIPGDVLEIILKPGGTFYWEG